MSNATQLPGSFTPYTCKIDAAAKAAFSEALAGLVGVRYSPVAVSQQLVAGMNYRFFCNTELVTRHPANGAAVVSIYKPLDGKAHITRIQEIH